MTLDGIGIYGSLFHGTLLIAMMGSALLIFINLWRKNRLDMDEEPKMQMLESDGADESNATGEGDE